MAKKARKAKAGGKKRITKKKTGRKSAARKKASAKKPAPAMKARKAAKKARALKAAAPLVAGFAPADDETKLLAVTTYVDDYMNVNHGGWSDDDKVVDFQYNSNSIAGVLGIFRDKLKKNRPQSYTLTITKALRVKCTSSAETVGDMKIDVDNSTK